MRVYKKHDHQGLGFSQYPVDYWDDEEEQNDDGDRESKVFAAPGQLLENGFHEEFFHENARWRDEGTESQYFCEISIFHGKVLPGGCIQSTISE